MERNSRNKRVFRGARAKDEAKNPLNHLPTPLIEIVDAKLNPFDNDGVRIFAKDLRVYPFHNVKALTVFSMLKDAEEAGELEGVHTLVEATSGNTGWTLASMTDKNVITIVPPGTPAGKIRVLQAAGAQVYVANHGIELAKEMGEQEGFHNLAQYENPANQRLFHDYIGPEIWDQTEGEITVYAHPLGTAGSITGIGSSLQELNINANQKNEAKHPLKIVGVELLPGQSVSGVRTAQRLLEVSHPWREVVDSIQDVGAEDSYDLSLRLWRNYSMFAGATTGFALQGLHQEIRDMQTHGTLNAFRAEARDKRGEVIAVFPIMDEPWGDLENIPTDKLKAVIYKT